MIFLIIKIVIYYLLFGMIFAVFMAKYMDDIISGMRFAEEEKLKDMSDDKLRKILVIVLAVLWPVFLYKFLSKKSE